MLIVVNGSVDRALGPLLFVGTRFLLSGQRLDHYVGFVIVIGAYSQGVIPIILSGLGLLLKGE